MRKKILQLIVVLVAACQMQTFAQTSQVTGRVIGPDNNPVAGASVTINGTSEGTVTDADGNFAISVPDGASLLINSIGFTNQLIRVDGRSVINVTLAAGQSAGLEEVVVTGYTSQKRKDIVGSVAVVDMGAFKAIPAGSAMQALQGQAAGVDVVNNGSPGTRSSILIRGVTGFNNDPLVLIDGVQGNINDVPPADIESVQVLKDAGAASIYGARAANGVVIITTKRGKSGQMSLSYNSYYNLQLPRSGSDWNLLNSEEYARLYYEINPSTGLFPGGNIPDYIYRYSGGRGIGNAGDAVVDPARYRFDPQNVNNNYIITELNKQGTDWYGAIFDPALMMNHSVTASGGTDRGNYLLSFGYLDHQGTMKNTFLKRYSTRINSTFKIRDNIRIGENVTLFYKNNPTRSVNGGFGPIEGATKQLPILPLYDIGGNYAGPYAGPSIDEVGDWGNPLADVELTDNNRSRTYTMLGNAFLEIDFFKNFTARTSIGGQVENYYFQSFGYPGYWTSGGGNNVNSLNETSGFATRTQWTNTLTYRKNFGDHNLSVLVGTESIENKARQQVANGRRFFSNNYNFLVLNNAVERDPPTSSSSEDALFSLLGKVDYSFADKYLVSLTLRRDGYSAFGSNNQYGTFPAIALGWRLSQESFMTNVTWVNDLKLRASYGSTGNTGGIPLANAYNTFAQNPGRSYYDITGSGNSIVPGIYPFRIGNPYTSWEENKVTNIGVDATLFNNKLDLSVEYYMKKIDGLLRPRQEPATVGEATSPFVNVGNVENKGVDINATYRARLSQDLLLTVGANFTAYKNKIVELPSPGFFDDGRVRFEEGQPMTSFFGYKVIGVFRDQKDVDDHATQAQAEPGRLKYLDADGDGEITPDDRVHFGDANPSFTLGLNLGLTYKNFDFRAQIYTAQGFDIYNDTYQFLGSFERGISNKSRRVLDAWTPTNTNTNVKKNELGRNFSNSGTNNSDFLEDGSFIRLRNVQVGYSIMTPGIKRLGFTNFRVYLQGINLALITNYSGIDPEVYGSGVGFRGIDAGAYVQEAGIALGLDITF